MVLESNTLDFLFLNDGEKGVNTVNSPGISKNIITVGSVGTRKTGYNNENYVYGNATFDAITVDGTTDVTAQTQFIEKVSNSMATSVVDRDYVFPNSDTVLLTEEDVLPILEDQETLQIARNEIYARHGRMFDTEWLQDYFNSKSWYEGIYTPAEFDSNVTLSDIETQNATYLVNLYNTKYGNQ